jgi:hypothetical protein
MHIMYPTVRPLADVQRSTFNTTVTWLILFAFGVYSHPTLPMMQLSGIFVSKVQELTTVVGTGMRVYIVYYSAKRAVI